MVEFPDSYEEGKREFLDEFSKSIFKRSLNLKDCKDRLEMIHQTMERRKLFCKELKVHPNKFMLMQGRFSVLTMHQFLETLKELKSSLQTENFACSVNLPDYTSDVKDARDRFSAHSHDVLPRAQLKELNKISDLIERFFPDSERLMEEIQKEHIRYVKEESDKTPQELFQKFDEIWEDNSYPRLSD